MRKPAQAARQAGYPLPCASPPYRRGAVRAAALENLKPAPGICRVSFGRDLCRAG